MTELAQTIRLLRPASRQGFTSGRLSPSPLHVSFALCAVAAVLSLIGCGGHLHAPADARPSAVPATHVLAVGRIRMQWLDEDQTDSTFFDTDAGADQLLLPEGGLVTWLLRRGSKDAHLTEIWMPGGWLAFDAGPILARSRGPADIAYFGTIIITFSAGRYNRLTTVPGRLEFSMKDEADETLRELISLNPGFSGREYFHVLRGELRKAPRGDGRLIR